jgi:putative selenium metabolism protein SsnA
MLKLIAEHGGTMLITNAKLITWGTPNQILPDSAIAIADGRIIETGPQGFLMQRYSAEDRLDAGGQFVMPGSICAHTHFYGAYSRGMGIPGAAPKDFPEILGKLWWPLDKALDPEDVYYSSLVCLIDAIKHGTTTLVDHHASPNAIAGSLDQVAKAVEHSGLRAALCYEVTDRDGPERAQAGIAENVRFLRRVRQENPLEGRLGALFGLHASLTLSDETLMASRAAVDAVASETGAPVGFHVHVAEHGVDEFDSLAKSGMRVADRLQRLGILGPQTVVGHAVHVDAREIAILAETNTWVSHQPRSNMNNGVGLPAVESMLRAGVRVCLGNDGFSNAMWEEWKAAYLGHKLTHLDPRWMPANVIAQMAIYNNRDLASELLGGLPLGIIAPGAAADLIFVDYQPYTPLTPDNLPWHMVFGFNESMITTTMVAGQVLMRDHQLVCLDEAKIAADARQRAPKIWERYAQQVRQAEGKD